MVVAILCNTRENKVKLIFLEGGAGQLEMGVACTL